MATPLTPAQRGDLAEAMVPVAAQLAFLVHVESPEAVHRYLRGIQPENYFAVMVVLAAMVDIERTPEELLAWARWHWDGWNDTAAA